MKVFSFLQYPIYLENLRNLFTYMAVQGDVLYVAAAGGIDAPYRLHRFAEPADDEPAWHCRALDLELPYKPELLVLNECWWGRELEVMLDCYESGIPAVVVEHGPPVAALDRHAYRRDLNGCLFNYLVGEHSKELTLRETGCPPERLVVTGWPRYDDLYNFQPTKTADHWRSLGADPEKRTILFLSTPALQRGNMATDFGALERFVSKSAEWQVILKPHPMEVEKGWVLPCEDTATVVVEDSMFHDLVHLADVVVTGISSVLVPAWYFRKPVFTYTVADTDSLQHLRQETEGMVFWKDPGVWDDEVLRFAPDYSRLEETLAHFAHSIDGRSSERVHRHMKEVVLPLVEAHREDRFFKETLWVSADLLRSRMQHRHDRQRLNRIYRELNELKKERTNLLGRYLWWWLRKQVRRVPGVARAARWIRGRRNAGRSGVIRSR